jgi:ribosome-binding factor A
VPDNLRGEVNAFYLDMYERTGATGFEVRVNGMKCGTYGFNRVKGQPERTVSEVRVSPDLSIAKVYVSIFPSSKQEEVMKILEENNRQLRGELGRQVAKQLRIVPELDFYLDTTLDYVEHIEELLKK